MAKENYLERTCRQCGKKFMGFPRSFYCPECQEIRKKEQKQKYNDSKRAGGVVPLGSVIKCEICGKPIVKTSGRSRFCPDCAAKTPGRAGITLLTYKKVAIKACVMIDISVNG